ncbi:hypothetical protein LTR66_013162 [Elasticomyces elasticus]|nr:hypothetical protein LTR66_013162 [Elasticomyces elasticus]
MPSRGPLSGHAIAAGRRALYAPQRASRHFSTRPSTHLSSRAPVHIHIAIARPALLQRVQWSRITPDANVAAFSLWPSSSSQSASNAPISPAAREGSFTEQHAHISTSAVPNQGNLVPEQATQVQPTAAAESGASVPPLTTTPNDPIPAFDTAATSIDTSAVPFDAFPTLTDASIIQSGEYVGYLHAIGIDYGWGFTSMIQWTLEHIHVWGGLPWWGSIVCTAALIRLMLFPLSLRASDMTARQMAMMPVTKPINDKLRKCFEARDTLGAQMARQELKDVYARAGVKPYAAFQPAIIQGILGFCAFRLLRAMAALPVPPLETGGFLWLTDLTVADPIWLLPALLGGTLHLLFRFGGETGAQQMTPTIKKILMYAMPGVAFLTTAWLPGALALWFTTTTGFGVLQAVIMRSSSTREFLGLHPLVKPDVDMLKDNPLMQMLGGGAAPTPSTNPTSSKGVVIEAQGSSRATTSSAAQNTSATAPEQTGLSKQKIQLSSGVAYQAPKIRTNPARTTKGIDASKSSASSASPEQSFTPGSQGNILTRAKDNVTATVNKASSELSSQVKQGVAGFTGKAAGGDNEVKGISLKSKEFLKRARLYEERRARELEEEKLLGKRRR